MRVSVDQIKLLAFIRAAEDFAKAHYAGDKERASLARKAMNASGFESPEIDDCYNIDDFQTALNKLKEKHRLPLENQLMRGILEGQLPHILARERARDLPEYSALSMAGYIKKILAGEAPAYQRVTVYHLLIRAQWKLINSLIKGEKPKKLFIKVKKLQEKIGFDAKIA